MFTKPRTSCFRRRPTTKRPAPPRRRPPRRRCARLAADARKFDALARTRSACPSAANGGRFGQLTRGDLVAEIETFVFALEEGQICPLPVMTRYGAHVLRVDRRAAGQELPFELVSDRIVRQLSTQSWQRAVSQYLRILAGRASIEGIEIGGAATPLVQ